MTENRTLWKSDNQGVKEDTFIQTSRRGGDTQAGWRGLVVRQWLADQASWWIVERVVPCSCVDKLGGTTEEQDRPSNPGLRHRKIKPQTTD